MFELGGYTYFTSDDGDNIKYDIGTEEDLIRFSRHLYGDGYLPNLRPNVERRIAGSKRVERYQLVHGRNKGSKRGWLLQSITAHPALLTWSFEVCVYLLNCLLLV